MVYVVQHRRKVGVAGNKKAAKMEAARAMLVDIEEGLEEENKKDETKVEDEEVVVLNVTKAKIKCNEQK